MSTFTKAIQQTVQTIHVDQVSGSTAVIYEPPAGTWALVRVGWSLANAVGFIIGQEYKVQGYDSLLVNWYDLFTMGNTIGNYTPGGLKKPGITNGLNPSVTSGYAVDLTAIVAPGTGSHALNGTTDVAAIPFIRLFPEMRMVCTFNSSPTIGIRHSVQVISYKSANNGV